MREGRGVGGGGPAEPKSIEQLMCIDLLPLLFTLAGPSDILKAVFYCWVEGATVCSSEIPSD